MCVCVGGGGKSCRVAVSYKVSTCDHTSDQLGSAVGIGVAI